MRRVGVLGVGILLAVATACSGSLPPTGAPTSKSSTGGTPTAGTPTAGTPTAGTPTAGTPPPAGTPTAGSPAAVAPGWGTYHGGPDRAGVIATADVPDGLQATWRTRLDGAVYAQPLLVGGRIIAATENDSVYALDPAGGHVLWRARVGRAVPRSALPCGNIDPLGVTGTPAYDAGTGSVFLVAETTGARHDLVALDAATGRERWRRNLDVVNRDRAAQQQRAALLVHAGRVYAAFGGLYGDCGDYVGYVTAVSTDGSGPVLHWAVPTAREGGIWAPPGPVAGPGGDVYVAVGNGAATGGRYDGSDSVVRLSPDLQRRAVFAPSGWAADNAADLDLGSSSPVPVGADQLVIAGKRGTVYLVDGSLGGIGGERASIGGCRAYGGAAHRDGLVLLPCRDGVRALRVSGESLHWLWHAGVAGSPVVLGGSRALSVDAAAGRLVLLDLATGRTKGSVDVGTTSRFATPAPAGPRTVVVGTLTGVTAVRWK